jgi:hypothetical protein
MCPAHKLRAEDALFESAAAGCVPTGENADEMQHRTRHSIFSTPTGLERLNLRGNSMTFDIKC